MADISLDWVKFKSFVDNRGLSIQYFDMDDHYRLWAYDGPMNAECRLEKDNEDCTDFETNYKSNGNLSPKTSVETRREVTDAVLQGAAIEGLANESGICEAIAVIPNSGVRFVGRIIDWGEAWITGESHPDDKILSIDIEAPLGEGGAWEKVSGYLDDQEDGGWWLPQKPAIAEVEPLGYWGLLPYGTRLKIRAQCGGTLFENRKLKVNLGWGRLD